MVRYLSALPLALKKLMSSLLQCAVELECKRLPIDRYKKAIENKKKYDRLWNEYYQYK